jgi:PAS domain S-box-containing protein
MLAFFQVGATFFMKIVQLSQFDLVHKKNKIPLVYALAITLVLSAFGMQWILNGRVVYGSFYILIFPLIALIGTFGGKKTVIFSAIFAAALNEIWVQKLNIPMSSFARIGCPLALLLDAFVVGFLAEKLKGAQLDQEIQTELNKKNEASLQEIQERFVAFMEHSPAAAWIMDRSGRFLYVNPTYYKLFSVEKKDLMGCLIKDVYPEHLSRRYLADNEIVFTGGQTLDTIVPGIRLSNEPGEFLISKFLIQRFNGDSVLGGIASDVTELRKNEKELRAAKEAAEVASREKLEFLATMSHELRTPLNSILGFSEILGGESLSNMDRIDFAIRVQRSGEMLTRLINQILDFSKIESGKIELEIIEIDLLEVVKDVIGIMSQQARKKDLILNFEIQGQVPETVNTDPTRLRQILTNLIGNAIKFTAKGWVKVTMSFESDKNILIFMVEDTGEGISAASETRLFEPFVQADSSHTRRFGGTGLGLSISRKIAQALGGDVALIKTTPNQGSTFMAKIAVQNVHLKKEVSNLKKNIDSEIEKINRLSGVRILVTDDSPDNLLLIQRLLSLQGAVVDTASSGQEALTKTVDSEYDIILMDIQMPEMDGFEATRLMRQRGYKSPIIALTAHAVGRDQERSLKMGFNDYIVKPIDKRALVNALLQHLPSKKG